MISTTHKFIFIHVPKTGGNSIQAALSPFADDKIVATGRFENFERFDVRGPVTRRKHMSLQEYADALDDSLSDYTIICTLRDPLERALSLYYNPRWVLKGKVDANAFDLSKFVEIVEAARSVVQLLSVGGSVRRPDIILWFDTLDRDFRNACYMLGLPGIDLQRLNVSGDVGGLREERKRDPQVIEIVRKAFAADYAFIESLRAQPVDPRT